MANKLLVQQFQTIIHSLLPTEIEKLFHLLKKFSKNSIKKASQSVGYKCWETIIDYEQIKAIGFGRDELEASHTCTRNFIDVMLEQDDRFQEYICVLKASLKELRDPTDQDNKVNESNFWSGMNQSFDQNLSIENLEQKIGNISMINDQIAADNTMCIENEEHFLNDIKQQLKPQNQQNFETPKTSQQKPKFITSVEKLGNLQRQSIEVDQFKKTINDCSLFCLHEQELKKEKLKIEHLELRMKLILEENRILKSMVGEQQPQQPAKLKLSKNNQENESGQGNISERPGTSTRTRPVSVEDTKRLQRIANQIPQMTEKYFNLKNARVPKLNLEILPSFHGKQTTSINQQLISLYLNNHKQDSKG